MNHLRDASNIILAEGGVEPLCCGRGISHSYGELHIELGPPLPGFLPPPTEQALDMECPRKDVTLGGAAEGKAPEKVSDGSSKQPTLLAAGGISALCRIVGDYKCSYSFSVLLLLLSLLLKGLTLKRSWYLILRAPM